jgi:hypothetical protein
MPRKPITPGAVWLPQKNRERNKTMATKEKTNRPAREGSIYSEMKISDMSAIDLKITELLTAEGFRVTSAQRFEGMKINNFTNINHIEYTRREHERVIVRTNEPPKPEVEDCDIRIGHGGDALNLLDEMIGNCESWLPESSQSEYMPKLEALRDAIERGIV